MYTPVPYLLAAWLLIYVPHTIGGAIRGRMEGGYDNRAPRAQQAKLTGLGARTVAAHQNGFETFPLFAAAAILCAVDEVDPTWAHAMSAAWLALRAGYIGAYLADVHPVRSLCWLGQSVSSAGMLGLAWLG